MPRRTKEKLTPAEALDETRRLLDREMRFRWKLWRNPQTAHEYYAVNYIRREFKKISNKVVKDADLQSA